MDFEATDELIRILQHRESKGARYVQLSATTRTEFFEHGGPEARERAQRDPKPGAVSAPESNRTSRVHTEKAMPAPPPEAVPAEKPTAPSAVIADVDVAAVSELDLDGLQQQVARCRKCRLHESRTHAVFGEGDTDARLMFIGEAPGYEEDRQGRPFVGAAGGLLDRMIAAMQFRREDVYIANIVKCRPPANRRPEDTEGRACLPYLRRQIELVSPDVLVLLGGVALDFLLGLRGINKVHGQWLDYEGVPAMPTFHPAYLLRVPQKKRDAWQDLQAVMERLGKDPETTMKAVRAHNE